MREIMINEPLPDLIVHSTRRIVIRLNLPDYEARSLADAICESRGYLEAHSPGGWGSDPQVLIRLEQAIRAELSQPDQGTPAPGAGAFLADGTWSTDEDDPPGDVDGDPGESEASPFGPGAGSAPASSPSASSEEPREAAPASPAGSQTASPAASEPDPAAEGEPAG